MRILVLSSLIIAIGLAGCDSSEGPGFLGIEQNTRSSEDSASTEASGVVAAYVEVIASDLGLRLTADGDPTAIQSKITKGMRRHLRIAKVLNSKDETKIVDAANAAILPVCKEAGLEVSAALHAKIGLVACSRLACTDEEFKTRLEASIKSREVSVDQKDTFVSEFMPEFMAGAPDQNAAAVALAVASIAEIVGTAPDATLAEMAKHARSEEFLNKAMAGTAAVMTELGFSEDQIASVFTAVQESATYKNATDQGSLFNTLRKTVEEQTGDTTVADIFASVADAVSGVVAAVTANSTTTTTTTTTAAAPAINYPSSTLNLTVGVAMTANDPASGTFTGATGKSCSISPALPAGLALNTTTCVISGTPTTATAQATYTITITDTNGSGTDAITITISRPAFSATFDLTSASSFNCDGAGSCASNADNVTISGGTASLISIDLKTDTAAEWTATGTTLTGVTTSSDTLTLNSTINSAWHLDESWTPQWDDMVIYYDFEGDLVNNRNPGTYDGAVVANAATTGTGKIGSNSLIVDGTGDHATTGYTLNTNTGNEFSIAFWLKTSDAGKGEITGSAGGGSTFEMHYNESSCDCLITWWAANGGASTGATTSSGPDMTDDAWHHVVFTINSSDTTALYVDGAEVGSATRTRNGMNPNQTLWLGGTNWEGSLNGNPMDGILDEYAIWETALTATEVAEIYQRQKVAYSGTYTSKVFDVTASDSLTTIAYDTPLPFGKSLTATAEATTTYSDIQASNGSSTLQNGLLAYFNFDGDVGSGLPDVSSNSHDGTVNGTIYSGRPGVIGNAWEYGSGNTTHGDITIGGAISISVWVKRDTVNNQHATIVSEGDTGEWDLQFEQLGDCIRLNFDDGGGWEWTNSNMHCIPNGDWEHIVYMRDSSFAGNDYVIYADGVQVQSSSWLDGASIADDAGSHDLQIGGRTDGSRRFSGLIDELGIWNRGLTSAEVLELYRRGANRISVLARTCPDATCSTDPSWIGSGGSQLGISEWHNNGTIASGNPTGTVNTTAPFFLFSNFVNQPTAQQYWQYRVIMESLDEGNVCSGSSRCNPVLTNLSLNERAGDVVGGSELTTYTSGYFVNSTAVSFSSLASINFTDSGTCKYQASPDGGSTFYYKTGGSWTTVSSDTNANASSDSAWSSMNGFPAGTGNLVIKAIMGGSGAACSITGIQVNGFN